MRALAVALVTAVLWIPAHAAAKEEGGGDKPPDYEVPGTRRVDVRDANGRIETLTSIPRTSVFAKEGGGPAATCTFTATGPYTTSDEREVQAGEVIESFYWFVEGPPPHELPPDPDDLAPDDP